MPPKPRQSRQNLIEQEGRIQLAIQALKKRKISSARRAAEVFNMPRSTLRDCLKGHDFQAELRNHKFQLSKNQEEALVEWIINRDTRGVAPRVSHVQQIGYLILQKDSLIPPKPLNKN
jgi:predicted HTH domain antitoxin